MDASSAWSNPSDLDKKESYGRDHPQSRNVFIYFFNIIIIIFEIQLHDSSPSLTEPDGLRKGLNPPYFDPDPDPVSADECVSSVHVYFNANCCYIENSATLGKP